MHSQMLFHLDGIQQIEFVLCQIIKVNAIWKWKSMMKMKLANTETGVTALSIMILRGDAH